MGKLLVYTPTFEDGPLAACVESIRGQQYGGPWEWVIDDDDPFPAPDHRNVLAKYQRAQKMALDGGYDALVTVEHDMTLPADALQKMVDAQKPVVYGVYVLRHGSLVLNAWRLEGRKNLGQSMSMFPDELERAKERADLWPVSGCGWGCTLIRRDVLERIPFHDGGGMNHAGDLVFAVDCLRAGIEAWAHFGVLCGHVENGVELRPFIGLGAITKVKAAQTFNGLMMGSTMHFAEGEIYHVPGRAAAEWERAGLVMVLEDIAQ